MMVLDHIGVAVASLERRLALYRALGLEVAAVEEVRSEKVRVAFLPVEGTSIELLEPTGPESPVAAFIAKRGEGMHHICFESDDVDAELEGARQKGIELIDQKPRLGLAGMICFLHPKSNHGVLVEFATPLSEGQGH